MRDDEPSWRLWPLLFITVIAFKWDILDANWTVNWYIGYGFSAYFFRISRGYLRYAEGEYVLKIPLLFFYYILQDMNVL